MLTHSSSEQEDPGSMTTQLDGRTRRQPGSESCSFDTAVHYFRTLAFCIHPPCLTLHLTWEFNVVSWESRSTLEEVTYSSPTTQAHGCQDLGHSPIRLRTILEWGKWDWGSQETQEKTLLFSQLSVQLCAHQPLELSEGHDALWWAKQMWHLLLENSIQKVGK